MEHNTFSCFVVFYLKDLGHAQNVRKLKTDRVCYDERDKWSHCYVFSIQIYR